MDFATLRDRVHEYCDFAGYADTSPSLDMAYLVNEAIRQISTMVEYNVENTTLPTVIGQLDYSLPSPPDWIRVTDVLFGTTRALYQTDEAALRQADPLWSQVPSGTPERWYPSGPNSIAVYPSPNSVTTLYIRGSREAGPLSAPSDIPGIPVRYHDAIPLLGAWLHLKKVAVGNEYQRAQNYHKEAMDRINDLQTELANQDGSFTRHVRLRPQERIWLGGWYPRR